MKSLDTREVLRTSIGIEDLIKLVFHKVFFFMYDFYGLGAIGHSSRVM